MFELKPYFDNKLNKKYSKKELCKLSTHYINDDDIKRYLGTKNKIIFWKDLNKYDDIKQVLPLKKDYRIILIGVDNLYNGHWVLITRNDKLITYFNSYGGIIGNEFFLIPKSKSQEIGQSRAQLTKLLNKAIDDGFKIIYNKKQLQKYENENCDNIPATCGKYAILYILLWSQYNYGLQDYLNFLDNLQNQYNLSYDNIVSILI